MSGSQTVATATTNRKDNHFLAIFHLFASLSRVTHGKMSLNVEEKVVVIHHGRCNNKVYYRLSHDVVT